MKIINLISLSALVILFTNSAFAEAKKYTIEPSHSHVTWQANHFGFSNQSGKFSEVEGAIVFDEKNPAKSSVEVTIKIASLATGLSKFDAHLKSADFFNLEKFTTAKFVSNKVTVTGKNKAKVAGDLTLMGITKPLTLDVTFNKSDINPLGKKETVGFSAKATITRSEFGIDYAVPDVSDKVNLIIETEANL